MSDELIETIDSVNFKCRTARRSEPLTTIITISIHDAEIMTNYISKTQDAVRSIKELIAEEKHEL